MSRLNVILTVGLLAAIPGFADGPSICDAISGNLVTNCGFETGDFTGWTVLNNDGYTQVSNTYWGPNSGDYYAALGTVGGDATIEQTIADTAGTQYFFSFFYGADGYNPQNFVAMWDNQTLLDLENTPAQPYTQYSFEVTGTGSDTISFLARNDPSFDALDDISVSLPEPSFVWLASAMAALLLIFRKQSA